MPPSELALSVRIPPESNLSHLQALLTDAHEVLDALGVPAGGSPAERINLFAAAFKRKCMRVETDLSECRAALAGIATGWLPEPADCPPDAVPANVPRAEPCPLAAALGSDWHWLTDPTRDVAPDVVTLLHDSGTWTRITLESAHQMDSQTAAAVSFALRNAPPGECLLIVTKTVDPETGEPTIIEAYAEPRC